MKVIFTLFFVLIFNYCNAESDTLYILYQEIYPNYIVKIGKHKDDPDSRDYYPFDGGSHYKIPSSTGSILDISFNFNSYTPEWMDNQFSYKIVNESILKEKNFKDRSWFDAHTYDEIVETFSGKDKVIYLIDEGQIKDGKVYMVRVYFSYSAEE
ncbi:MAG: hypothetical protein KDC79_07785 [Cyclobacteriaceae bacterium]|nr:hypothetical protein [Cyclobacteriaceae bacterium]